MGTRYARVEIDLGAIAHNVRALKALTPRDNLFMAVVKADGYGHGAVEVAKAAIASGADRLGVATIAEAIELRQAGLSVPIHLMQESPPETVGMLLDHDLVATVFNREFAVALSREASARGVAAGFHLKVDTGMNRIGVQADQAVEFASRLGDLPGLDLTGTFTHFATAEQPGDWDFEAQLQRFRQVLGQMAEEGIAPGVVHAANSAATIMHPESHFDMVRCGISLYGLHPGRATAERVDLRPAMSVIGHVSCVKRLQMGEGVSYGLTWRAAAPTTVATIPIGYADGLHRVLSNSMSVLIAGEMCPQIGRVTMDQIVVEVPRGVSASLGDEAVIVGSQGGERLTLDELADQAGTINYEMACAFGMRLERTFT